MKVKIIFFCFLYAQASASFFDEFRDTLMSVEGSFGNLVNDVVTDVRETLDCTILAVKQVLELGDSSDYNARCRGQAEGSGGSNVETTDENYSPMPPLLSATPTPLLTSLSSKIDLSEKLLSEQVSKDVHNYVPPTLSTATPNNDGPSEKSLSDNLSKEIEDSVVNLEKKMIDVIESHDTHKTVQEVKNRINNETKRLSEIGVLLHRELKNVTQDVKEVFHTMQSDYIQPSLTNIWRDVKVLHEMEINHTNAQDAAEIRHILQEILSVLHVNSDQDRLLLSKSNDKDSNKTYSFIESEFETMKQEEERISKQNEHVMKDLYIEKSFIESDFEKIKEEEEANIKENATVVENLFRENVEDAVYSKTDKGESQTGVFPLTFQDVAKKIIEETKNTYRSADGTVQKYEEIKQTPPKVVPAPMKVRVVENIDSTDYFLSQLVPKDIESRKIAQQEALDIIKNSELTEMLMDGYFERSENLGTDVFAGPN